MDRLEDNTIKSNLIINNIETSTNIKEYYVILSILEGYLNMINVQHKIIKKNKRFLIESLLIYYNMVPEAGLEPAHSEEFQILSLNFLLLFEVNQLCLLLSIIQILDVLVIFCR